MLTAHFSYCFSLWYFFLSFQGLSLIFGDYSKAFDSHKRAVESAMRLHGTSKRHYQQTLDTIVAGLMGKWKGHGGCSFDPLPDLRKAILDSMASIVSEYWAETSGVLIDGRFS